jgi:hypothetical protein
MSFHPNQTHTHTRAGTHTNTHTHTHTYAFTFTTDMWLALGSHTRLIDQIENGLRYPNVSQN